VLLAIWIDLEKGEAGEEHEVVNKNKTHGRGKEKNERH
jgi:hypothetical protein